MAGTVRAIPEGYPAVTPLLSVAGAAEALEFYKKAFGADEIMRFPQPDGRIVHSEIRIGDSRVMVADEFPEMNFKSPKSYGGTPVGLVVYVENVDAFVERAIAAGAKLIRPVQNQFYGDRTGSLEDPFGHSWHVATHVEDVPADELQRRAAQQAQHQ